ncbi:MAG: isoprenylcysteine carboxylmethyltransferase family protein [Candidatus Micrarchaeota archaeon]
MHQKLVTPLIMWAIVIAGAAAIFFLAPNYWLIETGMLGFIVSTLAFINWLYFFFFALFENQGAAGSVAGVRELTKTGVYSKVRHPIYFADIALAWGIFLFLPMAKVLLAVVWLTLVLVFWAKLEEKALLEKFGKEYEEYKRAVPMLVPKLQH